MIQVTENVLLKDFTTFKIGGPARYFVTVKNEEELHEAILFAKSRKLLIFVLGGGSNTLVSDHGFSGLVIKNEIRGVKFNDKGNEQVTIEIGAGEVFDDVVALTTMKNLSGLENLSGIPGTVGGGAVQNVGAYGVELKDTLLSVNGLNSINGKVFTFNNFDCQYGYRKSVFKKSKKYIITTITLKLNKNSIPNINYAGLKEKLGVNEKITPVMVRNSILEIRTGKLPDWHKIGTAGSYFKNPIISEKKYLELALKYPTLPKFPAKSAFVKVPLAWVLDNICNLKGYAVGNVGLYKNQPLALVNNGGATAHAILALSDFVKKTVYEKTGIKIEEEVEFVK